MMKKLLIALMAVMTAAAACSEFDDSQIWEKLNDYETRIKKLETLCEELNTNISSLLTLVSTAIQNNDYVTGVVPVMEEGKEIGYTIAFLKSDPITLYHGSNGSTPIVGVAKDTDDVYYWTINGDWLLDDDKQKIRAVGKDGAQGSVGDAGIDGITPKLKIEEEKWFVSYDDGDTWVEVGQATGEPGQNGDAFFKAVNNDKDYLSVVLADGTEFKIPKYSAVASLLELDELTCKSATFKGKVIRHSVDLKVTVYYGRNENITIYNSDNVAVQEFDGDEFTLILKGLTQNTEYYYFTGVVCNGITTFGEVSSFLTPPGPVENVSTLDSDVICNMSKVSEGILVKQGTLKSTELEGSPSFDLVDVWALKLQPRDWTAEEREIPWNDANNPNGADGIPGTADDYMYDQNANGIRDRLEVYCGDGDAMHLEFNLPVNSDGNIAPEEGVEYIYTIQPDCAISSPDYYSYVDNTGRPYNELFHPETAKNWGYSWIPTEFDYCISRRGFDGGGVWYLHFQDGKHLLMDGLAPAVKGAIKVVRVGENYSFEWKLYDDSFRSNRITGQWSGPVRIKNS